ncbi:MAG: phage tail protein [Microcystis aeruginosa Ma_MB_F_20061100_S19]|uniref:Phage tail sheath protein n=1 Tax=Microcystis aeruginosa SPC777 TaxID=482300 RepID=S3J9L5_MICAE|nr:phage tail sheath C-terminal domain-containing protein [Microcystis aeruginosa]EPF21341.1 Phage tail sheath protein [Microcystis aeruginosa SPC777]OCY13498.1 MAG: phage tail protein [Microcystis aeruginosa CACIAM 03]TRU09510.1 MAG: phage tail protein [Microcystis aeruginosa Ma_MB_F_20061100_S19]TRU16119.1 MAG: phage tail protein [Microcystis aeruginosa Ma_MB_F_20061100_S19D]
MVEAILPGTYITVRDEGLISAGQVVSGNIGIVGTAAKGPVDEVQILGSFSEAKEIFGEIDPAGQLTLIQALEQIYNNGGKTVYAVRTGATATKATYQIKDSSDTYLVKLEAKTPGTWGNDIKIKISDADSPANSKKVELTYQTTKETYTISNASDLEKQVNDQTKGSTLVTATLVKDSSPQSVPKNTGNLDEEPTSILGTPGEPSPRSLPTNTGKGEEKFATGSNGSAGADDYKNSLAQLENELVNLVLLAGQDASDSKMATALLGHLNATAGIKRERIGLIGSGTSDDVDEIAKHSLNSERLIFVAPGLQISPQVKLSGAYTAAAVAGLLASLPVQASPTNKPLTIPGLSKEFSMSQLEKLVGNRVLAIEKREGFRVVKGITTATNSAWHQITTRRIVDYAIYGVRSACNPYIGKLNNERVRGAMKATLDAFLTRMVQDEALISYELTVTANRAQEIAGEAIVTVTLRPTFSIDFIKVTMYLG